MFFGCYGVYTTIYLNGGTEFFGFKPSMGGLHNLINLHTASMNEQELFSLKI